MRILALLAAMLWLALAGGTVEAQTTRAVFVGVDSYLYSRTTTPDASFNDLRGAVADTIRFKNLLRAKYQLDLDRTAQGKCPDVLHPVSITLLNTCATRTAILDALDRMITQSVAKDTLIFYFAGHGSQYADDTKYDQASGYNGTILPTDARNPAGMAEGDILDRELKAIKERAVAKGIYFISIFDSCNSGTGTRDGSLGQSRDVPRLEVKPPTRPAPPPASGPGDGYWVHFAAAQDGEQAQEVGAVGKREGVFTTALIGTLQEMPFATFGDIIREVQVRVADRGSVSQTPMAEGSLKASFGHAAGQGTTYAVEPNGKGAVLKAGRLSGITEGSVFALYENEADALLKNGAAWGSGTVAKLSDFDAALTLKMTATNPPRKRLTAIETHHAFGTALLGVENRIVVPADKVMVAKALAASPLVARKANPIVSVAAKPDAPGEAQLLAGDGTPIGDLGQVSDPAFAERLAAKLKKINRVQQLLALRTSPDKAALSFCIDDSDYPPNTEACPPTERPNLRVLAKGAETLVTVENKAKAERYLYVLGIDPAFGVTLIIPQQGANDSAVPPLKPHRVPDDPVVLTNAGIYRFVTLATDKPINAAAFEQEGTRARAGTACASALERLLCAANSGKRDGSAPRVGDWSAIVDTVLVEERKSP